MKSMEVDLSHKSVPTLVSNSRGTEHKHRSMDSSRADEVALTWAL